MAVRLDYPEGATPLDPNELGGLKHRHVTTQGKLDELEQANRIRTALAGRRRDILTDDFAIELHRRLFGEVWSWAGSFRKTGKNIGIDPAHIGIELRAVMDDALYWADRGTYRPVEMAVRLHHHLLWVHPFANGNGRHARIMGDVVLEKIYGAGPIDWTAGSDLHE
jgi:Fic-DOC domain mobile mystery protein B